MWHKNLSFAFFSFLWLLCRTHGFRYCSVFRECCNCWVCTTQASCHLSHWKSSSWKSQCPPSSPSKLTQRQIKHKNLDVKRNSWWVFLFTSVSSMNSFIWSSFYMKKILLWILLLHLERLMILWIPYNLQQIFFFIKALVPFSLFFLAFTLYFTHTCACWAECEIKQVSTSKWKCSEWDKSSAFWFLQIKRSTRINTKSEIHHLVGR